MFAAGELLCFLSVYRIAPQWLMCCISIMSENRCRNCKIPRLWTGTAGSGILCKKHRRCDHEHQADTGRTAQRPAWERNLKLETLAEQTGLSKSALSKYESDDVTDLSIYAVTTLAEFYGVTTDYLLGVTENKKRPDAVLSDLHLSDGAVDVLRNGKFNHRLLCELIVHENFQRFMTDLEIYVDGYVSANIQNLNAGLEATRQMLKKKYAADENDLYMSTLKLGQIDEDEYFGRVLYDELVAILKNIKTEHRKDKTTSDGSMIDNLMKELEDAQKHEGSADEKKIRTALKAIGINYDKLTEDERKLIKKILYKTAMLKPGTLAGNRGKHRR